MHKLWGSYGKREVSCLVWKCKNQWRINSMNNDSEIWSLNFEVWSPKSEVWSLKIPLAFRTQFVIIIRVRKTTRVLYKFTHFVRHYLFNHYVFGNIIIRSFKSIFFIIFELLELSGICAFPFSNTYSICCVCSQELGTCKFDKFFFLGHTVYQPHTHKRYILIHCANIEYVLYKMLYRIPVMFTGRVLNSSSTRVTRRATCYSWQNSSGK